MTNNPASNLVKYVVSSVWSGVVWIYKLFFAAEDVNQATNGGEFVRTFHRLCTELNLGNLQRL